jgi:predicted RNA-binding Zn-ribbon protein involved in translation (DUF1610 family)
MTDLTPFEKCDAIAQKVFAKCKEIAKRQGKNWPDDYDDHTCPDCGSELITLNDEELDESYTLCPKCPTGGWVKGEKNGVGRNED